MYVNAFNVILNVSFKFTRPQARSCKFLPTEACIQTDCPMTCNCKKTIHLVVRDVYVHPGHWYYRQMLIHCDVCGLWDRFQGCDDSLEGRDPLRIDQERSNSTRENLTHAWMCLLCCWCPVVPLPEACLWRNVIPRHICVGMDTHTHMHTHVRTHTHGHTPTDTHTDTNTHTYSVTYSVITCQI